MLRRSAIKLFSFSTSNKLRTTALTSYNLTRRTTRLFSSSTHMILIENGTVINADREFKADILIKDGKIAHVCEDGQHTHADCFTHYFGEFHENIQKIDATGKYIIPGGIDPHVHLEMPFMGTTSVDGYKEATRAALAGGTTCLIDFIIPQQQQSLPSAYQEWRKRAEGNVCCDYSFHCGITNWDDIETPLGMQKLAREIGIPSFKVFLAYKGSLMVSDEECLKVLQSAKKVGAVTMAHCENGEMVALGQEHVVASGVTGPEGHYLSRPEECEAEATHRMISLAQMINTPLYVVHVMSLLAADEVARGRRGGAVVFGETLAATLGVDGTKLYDKDWQKAAGFVMSPPLNLNPRTKTEMMKRVGAGELQVISTDNCTFRTDQKAMGKDTNFTKIPNGINGIEDRLSIVWSNGVKPGYLSKTEFVRATSTQAAQIFNMYPQKGVVQVGSDADLVIWDGDAKRTISRNTHHHAVDFNIFEGQEVTGCTDVTISGGVVKYQRGVSTVESIDAFSGSGKFIARKPFGYAFDKIPGLDATRDPAAHHVHRHSSRHSTTKTPTASRESTATSAASVTPGTVSTSNATGTAHSSSRSSSNNSSNSSTNISPTESALFESVDKALLEHLPEGPTKNEVLRVLYGCSTPSDLMPAEDILESARRIATQYNFELSGVHCFTAAKDEQIREHRLVRLAALQNSIAVETTRPVVEQKHALFSKITHMIEAATLAGANIICLQEVWTAPFFMCTREKYPWVEFAESAEHGESTIMLQELAKKHGVVILSPILEKDDQGVLWNTVVVIDDMGAVLGKHRKNHIPRVGDFNEASYYMEGNTGHPVFDTKFGKIGINICYGRHHPLNWKAFGLNGAEIVVNPCATVGALSEPLWGVEARCAAIANSYFTVAVNRVGTELYPHEFTSGDGKPAHSDFGHFYGSSYITAPTGQRTVGLSRVRDGVLLCDLDLNLCDQMKQQWQFPLTSRLDMYAKLFTQISERK